MNKIKIFYLVCTLIHLFFLLSSCSKKIHFNKLEQETEKATPIALSHIRVPIKINLTPIFNSLEQSLQFEYSSDGWPDEFTNFDCDTRYMYSFKTNNLKMRVVNNSLLLNFVGNYKIKGSQRLCIKEKAVSPWSPACSCGLGKEQPRRVNIASKIDLGISKNYSLATKIFFPKPEPVDKCEVCFFKKDITDIVMKQIENQLKATKEIFQNQLDKVNLKPEAEKAWAKLNAPFKISNYGFAILSPKTVYLSPISSVNDSTVSITAGLSAQPKFYTEEIKTKTNEFKDIENIDGLNESEIYMAAHLNYDSVTKKLNDLFRGRTYSFKRSFIKRNFIFDSCAILPENGNRIAILGYYSGTKKGKILITGKPIYKTETKTIELQNPQYQIETKDGLINLGRRLFRKKIKESLLKYNSFSIQKYLNQALLLANLQVNRNLYDGIKMKGKINRLEPIEFLVHKSNLEIRGLVKGKISIDITEFKLPGISNDE